MCVPILLSLLKILSEFRQRRREKQAKKDWKNILNGDFSIWVQDWAWRKSVSCVFGYCVIVMDGRCHCLVTGLEHLNHCNYFIFELPLLSYLWIRANIIFYIHFSRCLGQIRLSEFVLLSLMKCKYIKCNAPLSRSCLILLYCYVLGIIYYTYIRSYVK